MTWAKATDLDGKPVWVNMLQARMVVPRDDGGSTVISSQNDDPIDVQEEPEQLIRGEKRWSETPNGVGFMASSQRKGPAGD